MGPYRKPARREPEPEPETSDDPGVFLFVLGFAAFVVALVLRCCR